MTVVHPRESQRPIGHEEAEQHILSLYEQNHLPQGLMICGPRGIGKASFAYHIARHLLCGKQGNMDGTTKRVASNSHADLLVIEPVFDTKKNEYANEINAEQARAISGFLSLTAAESNWRVVLIDSADALNVKAANAILKILEEPPERTILMLIAHQPSMLLPTIRSRCQTLRLTPPSQADFFDIMAQLAPENDSEENAILAELTGCAPGLAAEYAEHEAAQHYSEILDIIAELPAYPATKIHAFADGMVRKQPHANWRLFTRLMLMLFSRAAKCASGVEVGGLTSKETPALQIMVNLRPASYWAARWQECADEFLVAQRLHLDYKQVIIAYFHSINTEEGFHSGTVAA